MELTVLGQDSSSEAGGCSIGLPPHVVETGRVIDNAFAFTGCKACACLPLDF